MTTSHLGTATSPYLPATDYVRDCPSSRQLQGREEIISSLQLRKPESHYHKRLYAALVASRLPRDHVEDVDQVALHLLGAPAHGDLLRASAVAEVAEFCTRLSVFSSGRCIDRKLLQQATGLEVLSRPVRVAVGEASRSLVSGRRYLSNATCLMRHRLFYERFVVSRITTVCYIIRHF